MEEHASRCYDAEMEALRGAFQWERTRSGATLSAVLKKMSPILEVFLLDKAYSGLYPKCKEMFEDFIRKIDEELKTTDVDFYNGMTDEIEEWRLLLLRSSDHESQRKSLLGSMFIDFAKQKLSMHEKIMKRTDECMRDFLAKNGC